MQLTSLGLVRGLIGYVVGLIVGMAVAVLGSILLGAAELNQELMWVMGLIFAIIGFLLGVGAMSDWLKWMRGIETPMHHGPPVGKPAWTRYFGVDYNHKVIGIQYGVTGFLLLVIGGSFALIFRTELADSGISFLQAGTYNTVFSMHGWVALAAILLGVGGMANYLVPLMIGAEDMAFPRLNSFAYWINVPAIITLMLSMLFGWDSGWTAYPPLSLRGPVGYQMVFMAIFAIGLSSILGSLNLIVTMLMMRPKGMTLFRMPIFCWAILATSLIQLTATQLIGQAFLMLSFERSMGMPFFNPLYNAAGENIGGHPLLFQHLFWFYSHPAVYVFVLPGLGIISELLPVFSRKPLSVTGGWRFPAWRLRWSGSWSGVITCSPPATAITCASSSCSRRCWSQCRQASSSSAGWARCGAVA